MSGIGIIGAGGIGKRLRERLQEMNLKVTFVLRREHFEYRGLQYLRGGRSLEALLAEFESAIPETMCIAMSTTDKGAEARDYIQACLNAGIEVITCEKGSLAYHAAELAKYLPSSPSYRHRQKLAYTAAVGGGTQMLKMLHDRHLHTRKAEVHGVINGTCNYIFDEVARGGRTLGEACNEAARLGYAEPGARDPLSLINGELRDVVMKTCVLFNTTFAEDEYLTPDTLGNFELSAEQIEELSAKAASHRLVVSFSNRKHKREHRFFNGHFRAQVGDWSVEGGFRNTYADNELLSWLPGGVGNAIHVVEGELGSGGKYTLTGPGAGHEPTTTAMLNDLFDE